MSKEPLYVSIRIPKTGGSTLASILEARFGSRLQRTYDDHPEDPIVENPVCLHGHSVLDRFTGLITSYENCIWLTFLRDPLASAISMYHHTRKRSADSSEPHFDDKGLAQWLTHDQEFQWPNPPGYNHNRFTKWLERGGRGVRKFDFVGLTDRFNESVFLMYWQFQWPWIPFCPKNEGEYQMPNLEDRIIQEFRALNEDDYTRYREAADCLEQKKEAYGSTFKEDLSRFEESLTSTDQGSPSRTTVSV